MKTASQALIDHLKNGNEFRTCDLYTIELLSGQKTYYTSLDVNVLANNIVYQAGVLQLKRTSTTLTIGVQVDEMSVTVGFDDADIIGGAFWRDVARIGVLDGAKIKVERAFFTDWALPALGVVHVFEGNVGDIESGLNEVTIAVKSATELFNTMLPRSLYQGPCRNTLFDARCTINKAAHTTQSSVSSATNKAQFAASTGKAAGWFVQGYVVFTSGNNAGLSASVKTFDGTTIVLNAPLLFTPAAGDTFTIYTGCDGLLNTCNDKFDNGVNFSGEPFTPTPEAML